MSEHPLLLTHRLTLNQEKSPPQQTLVQFKLKSLTSAWVTRQFLQSDSSAVLTLVSGGAVSALS